MIGLKAFELEVPENLVPIGDLDEVKQLGPPERKLLDRVTVGMKTVAVAEPADPVDLAVRASRKALAAAHLTPDAIDVVISIQSRTPPHFMSSEATRVQDAIGATRAFAFAVADLGCANISNAIYVGRNLLRGDPNLRHVLISGGITPFGRSRYRPGVTVNGDAGIGVILSRDTEAHQILDIELVTDGRFWDLYRVDYKDVPTASYTEVCSYEPKRFDLAVASRNTFAAMNKRILERAKLAAPDGYIMQNLSVTAFRLNEEALGLKFLPACEANCVRYGHLGSADVLLNYKLAVERGEVKPGQTVLVQNNSPVACWSSMLLRV